MCARLSVLNALKQLGMEVRRFTFQDQQLQQRVLLMIKDLSTNPKYSKSTQDKLTLQGMPFQSAQKAYLDKGVYSKYCQVWLALCIVDQVEVDQLLQLQVLCLHTIHNICEKHGHVLAHRHGRNDFLDSILLLILQV
jgi:hypothetical protein